VGDPAAGEDQVTVLRGFAEVHRTLPQSRLLVVGSRSRGRKVRAMARELGVEPAVRLSGVQADVAEVLPGLDALVFADEKDGHSIAVVEALAAGCPVVATRVGGIPELIVHGEYGVLVPPRDPSSLAAALRCLAGDEGVRSRLVAAGPVRAADFGIRRAAARLTGQYLVQGARHDRADRSDGPVTTVPTPDHSRDPMPVPPARSRTVAR
jgi:glycosyltransferase involved in cell wall biosynthesis